MSSKLGDAMRTLADDVRGEVFQVEGDGPRCVKVRDDGSVVVLTFRGMALYASEDEYKAGRQLRRIDWGLRPDDGRRQDVKPPAAAAEVDMAPECGPVPLLAACPGPWQHELRNGWCRVTSSPRHLGDPRRLVALIPAGGYQELAMRAITRLPGLLTAGRAVVHAEYPPDGGQTLCPWPVRETISDLQGELDSAGCPPFRLD